MGRQAVFLAVGFLAIVCFSQAAIAATSLSVSTSDVTTSTVRISWSQTQDACFTRYLVQHREIGSGGWVQDETIGSASTTSTTIFGLTPDTSYEVRVVDEDCLGSQPSSAAQIRTTSLAAVGALAVGGIVIMIVVILVIVAVIVGIVRFIQGGTTKPPPQAAPPPAPVYAPSYQRSPPPPPPQHPVAPPPPPIQHAAPAPAATSKFCSQCGSPLAGPFCAKCGHRNW
jgi:hypothetical protein